MSAVHELPIEVVADLPAEDVTRRFASDLEPVGWLVGRAVYLATYWLRERIAGTRLVFPPVCGTAPSLLQGKGVLVWEANPRKRET